MSRPSARNQAHSDTPATDGALSDDDFKAPAKPKYRDKRLQLHTVEAYRHFPAVASWPKGLLIYPGLNTVPAKYWREYAEKFGEERLERLIEEQTKVIRYATHDGIKEGPAVTFFDVDQAEVRGLADGPPPPVSLSEYADPDVAAAMVDVISDVGALKKFLAEESRSQNIDRQVVVTALRNRLQVLENRA